MIETGSGDPRSDEDLLAAHVAGDPRAFAVIVHRHQNYLWAVARRTSATSEDASDALQEALLKAHRSAPGFRSDAKVTSWLHRIVVNCALDRIRQNRQRPAITLTDEMGAGLADPVDAPGAVDLRLSVGDALDQLPADQRAAVVAVDVEGYSVVEAADLLGVPPGTIKSRCSRGRAKLAVVLGHLRDSTGSPPEGNPRPP
ncbi:RNA polymerase sigma factor SigM [Williamsia sp. CHRR-6]|uniref:RNA polymerase sigma factor SigM n=1 Tax=Williamsia sp. CHRR-6 TaxID=2835871 RepID=UPI001BDA9D20|nr:RNA polymerase sigma factor SigM [Williamsia sp. CHRR-6]MBT0567752.1 RNA polymerase sigma factor SigM [Williamsia sp. CHRR-6]